LNRTRKEKKDILIPVSKISNVKIKIPIWVVIWELTFRDKRRSIQNRPNLAFWYAAGKAGAI
jgi:hypothetical protein